MPKAKDRKFPPLIYVRLDEDDPDDSLLVAGKTPMEVVEEQFGPVEIAVYELVTVKKMRMVVEEV